MPHPEFKNRLRQDLKTQRKKLSDVQLEEAGIKLASKAREFKQLRDYGSILSYAPINGEINPIILTSSLEAIIYLPRIVSYEKRTMEFLMGNGRVKANSLGINEPTHGNSSIPSRQLDAVLVPLLGFDRAGGRLGMGGGFYDRSFAFRLENESTKRPILIGLAHHFQELDSITTDPWDVPLDVIITDRELIQI